MILKKNKSHVFSLRRCCVLSCNNPCARRELLLCAQQKTGAIPITHCSFPAQPQQPLPPWLELSLELFPWWWHSSKSSSETSALTFLLLKAGCILFWNNVPKAGGLCGRVYINRAVLLHTVFGQKSTCDGSVFWSPRSSGWSSLLGWFPVHCSPAQSFELVCTDVTDSWLL